MIRITRFYLYVLVVLALVLIRLLNKNSVLALRLSGTQCAVCVRAVFEPKFGQGNGYRHGF